MVTTKVCAYDFAVDGIYYSKNGSSLDKTCKVTYFSEDVAVYRGDIVIPETVEYAGDVYTVTEIGINSFYGCQDLTSVDIPVTVKVIASAAFRNCIRLKDIDLKKVQEIGGGAFAGCVSLKDCLRIPQSVVCLSSWAFSGASSIKTMVFEDGTEKLDVDGVSGVSLDSVYIGRNLRNAAFKQNKTLRSVYVSDAVTYLPRGLFDGCENLQNIYGMENVDTLGHPNYGNNNIGVFRGCKSLKSFVVGNKVKYLYSGLFKDCTSLETLIIGNGIKNIGIDKKIVEGCYNLKTLYLGNNITSVPRNCLYQNVQRVYLFSDKLGSYSVDRYGLEGETVYVSDIKRYEAILGAEYNLKNILIFNETSLEYTGKTPDLSYKNNAEDLKVSFDNGTTPKDAGSYNTNIDVTFYNDKWSTTIELPCSYTITKAPLSVVANDIQRSYGEENPELKSIFVGFKNGETNDVLEKQPTLYTTATKESNAGTYPIYCSGAEARNYDITYERGTLTINKASQNITWNQDFSNVSVGDVIELTATCSSYMSVKYRSSDQSALLVTSENNKQYAYVLKPGIVALTAYQNGNNNYEEANEVSKIINIQATDIDEIHANNGNASYYDIEGRRITKPVRNRINIIRTDDGKIRKVFVK